MAKGPGRRASANGTEMKKPSQVKEGCGCAGQNAQATCPALPPVVLPFPGVRRQVFLKQGTGRRVLAGHEILGGQAIPEAEVAGVDFVNIMACNAPLTRVSTLIFRRGMDSLFLQPILGKVEAVAVVRVVANDATLE
jgi:hypothetical protein